MSAYGRSIATETLSYSHDGIVSALLRQAVVSAEETARQVPKPTLHPNPNPNPNPYPNPNPDPNPNPNPYPNPNQAR